MPETTPTNYTAKYDIFISYRRDGGEAMAILLRDRLTAKGYNVFLDIENLNSGSFNTKLFEVMDNCKDVLLICSIGSLDRCNNDGDWVRMEIARALEKGKNIIPIMLRGFTFPDVLPNEIEAIRMLNGVNANSHEYFDAAVDRLAAKFLKSKPVISAPLMTERLHEFINASVTEKHKKRNFKYAAIFAACVICLVFALFKSGLFEEKVEITVYNNTPNTVYSICFKRADTELWGENLVEKSPLVSGEAIKAKFSQKNMPLGATYDMRNIFYFGETTDTFTLEGFTMFGINGIVIYVDDNGEYAREFVRDLQ